jgi:hypothetical protein
LVEAAPTNGNLRVWVEGITLEGDEVSKGVLLPLGEPVDNARARLKQSGLTVMALGDDVQVMMVDFGSRAEKLGLEQGFTVTHIELPAERPAKEWIFVPTLMVLGLVVALQRARSRRQAYGAARAE